MRKLGFAGWFLALGLACLACSDDENENDNNDDNGEPASCEVAGRETDLCRVWVNRELGCKMPAESGDMLLARCRADWGEYMNRVAPCFVAEYSECALDNCQSDDQCYSDALVANDPSLVDSDLYRRCRTTPEAAGCDDVTRGFAKACVARADECDAFDDLCASVAALEQPYRAEGEACLTLPCEELEACWYGAMGRTPR